MTSIFSTTMRASDLCAYVKPMLSLDMAIVNPLVLQCDSVSMYVR